jgi:hypothetical protein
MLAGTVFAFLAALAPSSSDSPARAVGDLYAFHFAHEMAFTPDSVGAKSAWLAPDLKDLIDAYFARPVDPNEAPPINGDPFTDSQEYPSKFKVGPARVTGEVARVPVRLSWKAGPPRSVTIHLVRIGGRWRVWDVLGSDGTSLRALLTPRS